MRLKRALLIGLGALLALVALLYIGGLLLDERHVVTRSALLPHPPERVWAVIRDFDRADEWQPDVDSMILVTRDPSETWLMRSGFGDVPFRVEDEVAGQELVTRILDDGLPFGGTWTYQLEATREGTHLTITEDGFVRNPIFRLLSRFVFGQDSTIEAYLDALPARLSAP